MSGSARRRHLLRQPKSGAGAQRHESPVDQGKAGDTERAAPRVSVVIPALNEAENIPFVLASIPDDVFEIILVDGASTDDDHRGRTALPRRRADRAPGRTRKGQRPLVRLRSRDRRHHRHARRRRLGGRRRDPALCPGARRKALTSRKDHASSSGGGSADITALRRVGNRALGAARERPLQDALHRSLLRLQRVLAPVPAATWHLDCDGFEVETLHQHQGRPDAPRRFRRSRATRNAGFTVAVICTPCATGCGSSR